MGFRCNVVARGIALSKPNLENTPKFVRDIVELESLLPSLGMPNDIANVVAFLASDDARYMTGQTVVVDGGTWHQVSCWVLQPRMRHTVIYWLQEWPAWWPGLCQWQPVSMFLFIRRQTPNVLIWTLSAWS